MQNRLLITVCQSLVYFYVVNLWKSDMQYMQYMIVNILLPRMMPPMQPSSVQLSSRFFSFSSISLCTFLYDGVEQKHQGWGSGSGQKPDPGLCTNNFLILLDNAFFYVLYFLCQTSPLNPWVPDPVRILSDPGWFSESRTSMVRLTPKVRRLN